MRTSLQQLCGDFIENRDTIRATLGWESSYLYPVCAAIFADQRRSADPQQLRDCRDALKARTGVFSNFRSTGKLPLIAMMASDNDPEGRLERSLELYDLLKTHFFTSAYLPVAAMILAGLAPEGQYEAIARRTRTLYDLMKSEHPFLTSAEDSVFAAMLALSPLQDEEVVYETEFCYQYLKPSFFSGNAVQSLSHVLALAEGPVEEKCRRTLELFELLRARGRKYGTGYELATLGVAALLPDSIQAIAADLIEVDDWLKGQKGYGVFGLGRTQRMMHAAMLVVSDSLPFGDNTALQGAAVGGVISLIAAQQAAMCAAIAASTAAATSAS